MIKVVLALGFREDKIVCVSRKDNHFDFGLPGGKIEEHEDYIAALKREVMEETGLTVHSPYPVYHGFDKNNVMCYTYLCGFGGAFFTNEPHLIRQLTWEELIASGSFKEYNTKVFEAFVRLPNELVQLYR